MIQDWTYNQFHSTAIYSVKVQKLPEVAALDRAWPSTNVAMDCGGLAQGCTGSAWSQNVACRWGFVLAFALQTFMMTLLESARHFCVWAGSLRKWIDFMQCQNYSKSRWISMETGMEIKPTDQQKKACVLLVPNLFTHMTEPSLPLRNKVAFNYQWYRFTQGGAS